MHRFFAPATKDTDVEIRLPDSEAHHAARVLRVRPGEPVLILDGAGGEHRGEISDIGRREVTIRLTEHRRLPDRPFEITLVQAIAKGPAMEGLLHRAVELGCARVVPLVSERSVSRPDDAAAKQERWQTVSIEAAKQSGNPWLMTVDLPVSAGTWIARPHRYDLILVASLEEAPQRAQFALQRHCDGKGSPPRSVAVLIGPEGDFSPAEYADFRACGAQPISLGRHVLRVETAAIAALALLADALCAMHEVAPGASLA